MKPTGLLPLPADTRDFPFGALYTLPKLEELPPSFRVAEPLKIKDQGDSDLCTGYALTAVSEDQEGVELSPEYQFAKTKQISGDPEGWGADLRSACKSIVKFGSLEASVPLPEGNLRHWRAWPPHYDTLARKHCKESYFAVTGPYDTFDNIRATLWKNRDEKRSIFSGVLWHDDWTYTEGGIIDGSKTQGEFGHAIKVFGWRGDYLEAQLSNGTGIGSNGLFYFHRNIANVEFTYGAFVLKDISPEKVRGLMEIGSKVDENWFSYFIKKLFRV